MSIPEDGGSVSLKHWYLSTGQLDIHPRRPFTECKILALSALQVSSKAGCNHVNIYCSEHLCVYSYNESQRDALFIIFI